MLDKLTDINYVKGLQSNLRVSFDTPPGKEVMKFMELIGGWYPTIFDSLETNEVIARDANRRFIGTIKTLLELTPEQIVALAKKGRD
jgi:hypothetical protein